MDSMLKNNAFVGFLPILLVWRQRVETEEIDDIELRGFGRTAYQFGSKRDRDLADKKGYHHDGFIAPLDKLDRYLNFIKTKIQDSFLSAIISIYVVNYGDELHSAFVGKNESCEDYIIGAIRDTILMICRQKNYKKVLVSELIQKIERHRGVNLPDIAYYARCKGVSGLLKDLGFRAFYDHYYGGNFVRMDFVIQNNVQALFNGMKGENVFKNETIYKNASAINEDPIIVKDEENVKKELAVIVRNWHSNMLTDKQYNAGRLRRFTYLSHYLGMDYHLSHQRYKEYIPHEMYIFTWQNVIAFLKLEMEQSYTTKDLVRMMNKFLNFFSADN